MPETPPLLELENVSVDFGHHRVLADVNFRLDRDEFVVLLGANASGKTTMVKAALGLLPISDGTAYLYGIPISRFREWKRIGYVPQRVTAASGVPATVSEVVTAGRTGRLGFFGRLDEHDRHVIDKALDLVDLTDIRDSAVSTLSGGQQQRVLIARALAGEPEVLVLDEPVASVDLAHQESFAGTLSALREENTSILMVAHSLGAIQPLVTRAVVLDHGKIVHDGEPVDLHLAHAHHPAQEVS